MRANRRLLLTINLGFVVFVVGLVLLAARFAHRDVAFFAAGAAVVSAGFILWLSVESTPARRQFDGAEGERLTAGILRGLRSRRWKCAHNIHFLAGDVDHVVAGPGGVFAIETKWTNDACPVKNGAFTNEWDVKAVRQAQRGAERVGWLLAGNYNVPVKVRALVVIWGPGRPKLDKPLPMGDVLVVTGQLLRGVISDAEAIDTDLSSAVIEAIDDFARERHQHGDTCAAWAKYCECANVFDDVEIVSASVDEPAPLAMPFVDQSLIKVA